MTGDEIINSTREEAYKFIETYRDELDDRVITVPMEDDEDEYILYKDIYIDREYVKNMLTISNYKKYTRNVKICIISQKRGIFDVLVGYFIK